MRILALRVRDVRNLEPLELEPAPRFNVFHGDNGQGKTNLLETIYVVAALRSFRTSKLADLLRFDTQVAHIGARVERGGLERVYELTIEPRSRRARIDGKVVRPLARYFGEFNVVLFAPEDLQLPRGAPADRRRFLDRAVFNRRGDFMPLAQDLDRLEEMLPRLEEISRRAEQGSSEAADAEYAEEALEVAERVIRRRRILEQ